MQLPEQNLDGKQDDMEKDLADLYLSLCLFSSCRRR
jgi:hypothetical protein